MKIDIHNYEIVFVDYLDGKLTETEISVLHTFLNSHPELAEELNMLEPEIPLANAESLNQDFSNLKKHIVAEKGIDALNYQDFFIADFEGDLSQSEKENLENFLKKNDSLRKEKSLFQLTKTEANLAIQFPAKYKLKRVLIFQLNAPLLLRYAASVIVFAIISALIYQQLNPNEIQNGVKTLYGNIHFPHRNVNFTPDKNTIEPKEERSFAVKNTIEINFPNPTREKLFLVENQLTADRNLIEKTIPELKLVNQEGEDVNEIAMLEYLERNHYENQFISVKDIAGNVAENLAGNNPLSDKIKKKEKVRFFDFISLGINAISRKAKSKTALYDSQIAENGKRKVHFYSSLFEAEFSVK